MPESTVTAELLLSLVVPGGLPVPVAAGLRYDPSDPYAVEVTFRTEDNGDGVRWTFARQLLTDGVVSRSGVGDITVWPSTGVSGPIVNLEMISPHGSARFETTMAQVVEFLSRTYAVVPTGSEGDHLDLDAEIALLFDED